MRDASDVLREVVDVLSVYSVHVVGGAVRDRLMKRRVFDLDLICPRDPSTFAPRLAQKINGNSFMLDAERGIMRVFCRFGEGPQDYLQIDLARLQGNNLLEDLSRRDFTVNAMAVPLSSWLEENWRESVVDPYNGGKDLLTKTLKPLPGNPFRDDPLRLLRAFRLSAELGLNLGPSVSKAVRSERRLVLQSAPERIREEMLRLFSVRNSYPTVVSMEKAGLLEVLLPEIKKLRKTGHVYYGAGGVLKHTLDSLELLEGIFDSLSSWFPASSKKIRSYLSELVNGYPRFAHLKWGILLHDLGKPDTAKVKKGRLRFFDHEVVGAKKIPKIADRFRWSGEETASYTNFVRHHMRPGNLATHEETTDKAIYRFFRDLGDLAVGMLLISLGDHLSYLSPRDRKLRRSPHEKLTQKMIRRYYFHPQKISPPRLVSGHDLMKSFRLPPSRLIGEMLRDLEEAQTEGKIKTREEALSYLGERLPALMEKVKL